MDHARHRIGVLSDTHGLLRPEIREYLEGVEYIVHAGDVGEPEIVSSLEQIAPLTAVRGNIDHGKWAEQLCESAVLTVGVVSLFVIHNLDDLYFDAAASGFQTVIFGHTHHSTVYSREGVLYINPGSAGPRRFGLPVTLASLTIQGGQIETELISLDAKIDQDGFG